mmetsp:Transcript_49315/g.86852  ORF Transcript_49315/g.86852 Transcript_49315/m.86852 type:complete len:205 (-) Transcript_49315:541-1155(-)
MEIINIVIKRNAKDHASEPRQAKIAKRIFRSSRKNRRTRIIRRARTARKRRKVRMKLKLSPLRRSESREETTTHVSNIFQPQSAGETRNHVRKAMMRKTSSTAKIMLKAMSAEPSHAGFDPLGSFSAALIEVSTSKAMTAMLASMSVVWRIVNIVVSVTLARRPGGISSATHPFNPILSAQSCTPLFEPLSMFFLSTENRTNSS